MSEWMPIESAPKSGQKYLAVDRDAAIGVVWWNHKEQMFEDVQCLIEDDGMITHWMPLPPPPKDQE